jgi:hypothetical protein
MAEGAIGDWAAVYLRDNLAAGAGFAALGFAAYSLAMAAGRFLEAEGAKADRTGAGSYPCRKRRNASRLSCSACLVTRAFVAR